MADAGIPAAAPIPSYLIECLAWNVPNEGFQHNTLSSDVRYALLHLWNHTRDLQSCKEWGEVNELKYLFWTGQPWNYTQVNAFVQAAWNYTGQE